ncbi:amino acid permease, partial [Staphylococcus aureus]|nr:amino acid permease [Staphylococcus aureus]
VNLLTALLLSSGMSEAASMENILVILKVLAIILCVIVGLTAINVSNYVTFIPEHKVTATGDFGGCQGIYAGVSMIF